LFRDCNSSSSGGSFRQQIKTFSFNGQLTTLLMLLMLLLMVGSVPFRI
jgi:hypothetical protein